MVPGRAEARTAVEIQVIYVTSSPLSRQTKGLLIQGVVETVKNWMCKALHTDAMALYVKTLFSFLNTQQN